MRRLGFGVVTKSYNKSLMPGWRHGTVGYHIEHGKVFGGSPTGKETKGTVTFVSVTIDISWKGPIKVIPQKQKLPMNFFETFPECSLSSTVSKNGIKNDRSPFSFKRCDKPILPHLCLYSK